MALLTVAARLGWAILLGTFAVPGTAQGPVPNTETAPTLTFSQPGKTAALEAAYKAALQNLLVTNTIPYTTGDKEAEYNQTGLLTAHPDTFVRAGGGYQQPWTRDASVNSWSAASLLQPAVARNTLVAVLKRQPNGQLIVQQDNQWWDQVIWVIAAWHHYAITGDKAFLANAYQAAQNTLQRDEAAHLNSRYGLYEGPAFLNDGIAGYPAPPADATESRGSFVLAYPGANKIMVLSTNCLYAEAYRRTAQMATALGRPAPEAAALSAQGEAVAASVRQHLWLAKKGRFGYFLYPDGKLEPSQEGAGSAFALLFGVATPEQAASTIKAAHLSTYGIEDVYPGFPRVPAGHPGRHSDIVWPPISAFWAEALARRGDTTGFANATEALAQLAQHSDGRFSEIYNATTGKPDGGWQVGHEWDSEPDQTWSATGFLRMIYAGLFGMRFDPGALHLQPALPAGWGDVTLAGLRYRGMLLTLELHGSGSVVRRVLLDGAPQKDAAIPASLTGTHVLRLELGGGA